MTPLNKKKNAAQTRIAAAFRAHLARRAVNSTTLNVIPGRRRVQLGAHAHDASSIAELMRRNNWRDPLTRTPLTNAQAAEVWRLHVRNEAAEARRQGRQYVAPPMPQRPAGAGGLGTGRQGEIWRWYHEPTQMHASPAESPRVDPVRSPGWSPGWSPGQLIRTNSGGVYEVISPPRSPSRSPSRMQRANLLEGIEELSRERDRLRARLSTIRAGTVQDHRQLAANGSRSPSRSPARSPLQRANSSVGHLERFRVLSPSRSRSPSQTRRRSPSPPHRSPSRSPSPNANQMRARLARLAILRATSPPRGRNQRPVQRPNLNVYGRPILRYEDGTPVRRNGQGRPVDRQGRLLALNAQGRLL